MTLAEAQANLADAREAYRLALFGSQSWGDRSGSPPDPETLRREMQYWQDVVDSYSVNSGKYKPALARFQDG